jgi:photosystem II stability/assembly factor-like uncharacterized protein
MFFVNDSIGFTTTGSSIENRIFKTTDGGKTWKPKFYNPISQSRLYGIYFLDSLEGWAGSNDRYIYHTIDGGETWEIQRNRDLTSNIPDGSFHKIYFKNSTNKDGPRGYRKVIMTTDNGGIHWRFLNSPFGRDPLLGIVVSPQNELWMTGWSMILGEGFLNAI